MVTYCDALNCAYELFRIDPPAPSAQLVYLHLLHQNYCLGNPGTVQISDRELSLRTRLNKQSITEAKRTLKNRGLIDFKTDRDKPHRATTYILNFFSETLGQGLGQKVGQTLGQTLGQSPCLRSPMHAKTRASETNEAATEPPSPAPSLPAFPPAPPLPPTPIPTPNPLAAVAADVPPYPPKGQPQQQPQQLALAQAKPLRSPKIEEADIHDIWEYETGYTLNGSVAFELESMANENFELTRQAIIAAVKANTRGKVSFNYFKAIFNSLKNKKEEEKGGEKRASNPQKQGYAYAPAPEYDIDFERD